jgi:DNA-directed RNA polymerase specialized sigma24 family protein
MEDRFDRIEKLLSLILLELMKGTSQAVKIRRLNLAGFTNAEIADFLETKASVVAVRLSESRKKNKKQKT